MKTTPRLAFAATLTAIGFTACDPASPPDAVDSRSRETIELASYEDLAKVLRDEDPYARARRLGTLIPALGPEALPVVTRALSDPTLDLGGTEIELLVRFWASHEPEKATRWAVDWSSLDYRVAAVFVALPAWAEADPHAALVPVQQWAAMRPDVSGAALVALVRGWYASGEPGLQDYMRDLGFGSSGQRAVATYLRAMLQSQGAEAVMRWAEALTDDEVPYKLAVYRQVGAALMPFDRDAGLRWCEAHCEGPYGSNMRNIIARTWVMSDGPAAMQWLATAPEGRDRNLAVRATFARWGRVNQEAALAWMETGSREGELEPWLRSALPVYVRLLAANSPAEAIGWAEKIEEPAVREMWLVRVARAWRNSDEVASEAWLLQSSLSEEAREKVRSLDPLPMLPVPSS